MRNWHRLKLPTRRAQGHFPYEDSRVQGPRMRDCASLNPVSCLYFLPFHLWFAMGVLLMAIADVRAVIRPHGQREDESASSMLRRGL